LGLEMDYYEGREDDIAATILRYEDLIGQIYCSLFTYPKLVRGVEPIITLGSDAHRIEDVGARLSEDIEAIFFDMGGTLRTRVADEGLRHQALEQMMVLPSRAQRSTGPVAFQA
jgi:hypothetical protein